MFLSFVKLFIAILQHNVEFARALILTLFFLLCCMKFLYAQETINDSIANFDSSSFSKKIYDFKSDSNLLSYPVKPLETKRLKTKSLQIGGTISIEAQYASSKYVYQQIPQNYIRFHVAPKISLFGIPFTSSFNLTSEQTRVNYNINRFQFALDVNELSKSIKTKLIDKLENSVIDSLSILQEKKYWEDSLSSIKSLDFDISTKRQCLKNISNALDTLENEYPFLSNSDTAQNIELKYRTQYKAYQEKKAEYEKIAVFLDSIQKLRKKSTEFEEAYNKWNNTDYPSRKVIADELKRNPSRKTLKKYGQYPLLSKTEKLLLTVRDFKMGTINSGYSSPYKQGPMLNGISIDNSFGNIYTSLQAGILQQSLAFGSLKQQKPTNYLYAIKAGYGMPENTHLHASIIQSGKLSKGKKTNIEEAYIPTQAYSRVLGLDGALAIKNIKVEGDWAISDNSTQIGTVRNESNTNSIATPISFINSPNTAYLLSAKGIFFQELTTLNVLNQRVGANFNTPGNIFMRNDIQRYKVELNQKLYKNFVSVIASYQNDADNLLNQKRYTTVVETHKLSMKIRLKRLPSFILSYNNIDQSSRSNELTSGNYKNNVRVYTITSIYSKRLKTKTLTSSLTYIKQVMVNNYSLLKRHYNNIIASTTITDDKGNNITMINTVLINSMPYANKIIDNSIEVGCLYPKLKTLIIYAGINYTNDNLLGNNGGAFIRPQVSFWKKNKIALLVKQNFFRGIFSTSQTQYQTIVNIQFTQQW